MKNWMRKTIALLLALMLVTGAVAFAEKETVSDAFRLPTVKERVEDEAEEPAVDEDSAEEPVEDETPAEEPAEGEEPVEEETEVEPEGSAVIGEATVSLTDTTAHLNVRAEASESAAILGSLDNGTVLSVLANEGDWLKIVYGEGEGYVKTSLTSWGAEEEPVEELTEEESAEETVISEFEVIIGVVDPKEMYFEGDVIRIESTISGECNEPSYQWQVLRANDPDQNWKDIEGAIDSSYEYALTFDNCEDSYRVIVVDQAPTMAVIPMEEEPVEDGLEA